MIIIAWLPRRLNGIAWFPNLAIVSNRLHGTELERVINHERIHLRQQKELGYLIWIFLYLKQHFSVGYRKNIFERDAVKWQYSPHKRPVRDFENG